MTDKIIVGELGAWHGRSSRAIGDNLPENAVLYCIDTWNGSIVEQDTNHASAKLMDGDHAYFEFLQNNFDLIQEGKIIPLRMSGDNAAKFFKEKGIKFSFVFIDAGHTYEEVKSDIQNWKPLIIDGGTLCGHDYYHDGQTWEGVQRAVDEKFGHKGTNMGYIPGNSIWAHKIFDTEKLVSRHHPNFGEETGFLGFKGLSGYKAPVFDCFIFNKELDLLERRFRELDSVVDRFVIVEATKTHAGKDKELYFANNLERFAPWLHKVTSLVMDEYPVLPDNATVTDRSWAIERAQRDYIMKALEGVQSDAIIIISDLDEIPSAEAIKSVYMGFGGPSVKSLEMDLYYYDEHTKAKDKWYEAKVTTYGALSVIGPCGVRYTPVTDAPIIPNAGKHLSYFGGVDAIRQKIEDTAHQEYNSEYMKDPVRIQRAVEQGLDVFGRDNIKFEKV